MGREHAEAILSLGDAVVAFLDTDISRAKSAAEELGGEAVAVGADIAAALERFASVGGAAVLVASPSALHVPHARAALSLVSQCSWRNHRGSRVRTLERS